MISRRRRPVPFGSRRHIGPQNGKEGILRVTGETAVTAAAGTEEISDDSARGEYYLVIMSAVVSHNEYCVS